MSVVLPECEDVAWFRDDLIGSRGAAVRLAERIGLSERRAGEVALAVSEAAASLAKHAVAGAVVLRVVRTAQQAGVEFLVTDSGPGVADGTASMRDGRSTTATLGLGLGTIARLCRGFQRPSALRGSSLFIDERPSMFFFASSSSWSLVGLTGPRSERSPPRCEADLASRVDVLLAERASPARARSLLKVREAISSARPSEVPRFSAPSLMCSYWRARLR